MNTVFNAALSYKLKTEGMEAAAFAKDEELALARKVAISIAESDPNGECHADLVQAQLISMGISLGNAAGSIFKSSDWKWTGRYINSTRVKNHSRVIRVWKLVQKGEIK